jgi:predicted ATPase
MNVIKELVKSIQQDFSNGHFDKFIHDATFPNFKKIKPFTKVEFKFPLTVLVGANGGGKSSILHALWGMPLSYSTNRFWFSTPIDPINEESAGKANIPRYWYAHYIKAINKHVQTRKVKGKKSNGYWEPSRPATNDGMAKMPPVTKINKMFMSESGDRWTAVQRVPHYINTKSETSAFDRFFYHTELTKISEKQDFFIWRSGKLRNAIQKNSTSVNIGAGVFAIENVEVSPENLKIINRILGKHYKSAKKILHELFDRNKSPSVIFETEAHTYSESFAGSGELSVVNLVLRVEALKEFDLLLIDEPETSLHPGAQKELLRYLLQKTKDKKLQVVIATHSPTIVDLLPECALVVLDETSEGTTVNPNATKSSAFYRLGQPDPNKVNILTEDKLLLAYLERVKSYLPQELQPRILMNAAHTGASEMLSHQVPAFIASNTKVILIMDGDQQSFIDLISQNPASLSPEGLLALTENLKTKCNVSIVGSNPDVPVYMRWCKQHVLAIPQVCPEQIFLELLHVESAAAAGTFTNKQYKEKVRKARHQRGDGEDAAAQYILFKSMLGEAIRNETASVVNEMKSLAAKIEVSAR